jgi:hypothetical protein
MLLKVNDIRGFEVAEAVMGFSLFRPFILNLELKLINKALSFKEPMNWFIHYQSCRQLLIVQRTGKNHKTS